MKVNSIHSYEPGEAKVGTGATTSVIFIWALYMKGDHAPTFDSKLGFVDGMLFRSRFPRVAEYLSTVETGAFVTPGPVAVNKTLETSIL